MFPADQLGVSSLHLTFNTAEEARSLNEVGYLQRTGIQYHWENRNYITFEDFLADLKQSKRKNIRQVSFLVAQALSQAVDILHMTWQLQWLDIKVIPTVL